MYYIRLELAKDPPEIRGGLPSYQLGDRLALNCTSQRTYPATTLRWILNGKEVQYVTIMTKFESL